jgi:hypothetical protein
VEKPAPANKSLRELGIQTFQAVEINRSQIQNAPYNPRVMGAEARRRLKNALKKLGLLQPLVWNVRSGNLVGGHQRLSIIDQLVGNGQPDFTLTVAQVDLSHAEEVEANLVLNNDAAMGEFDLEKLGALIKTPGLDITGAGWEAGDMFRLFGDVTEKATPTEQQASIEKSLERLLEQEKSVKEAKAASIARDREDFYLVVVFRTYEERVAFTNRYGLEDNRYQSGEAIEAIRTVTPVEPPPAPASDDDDAPARPRPKRKQT